VISKDSLFENTIRKDKYNSIIFDKGRRRELYLVGGYLRDLHRGIDTNDRDYIVRGNLLTFVRDVQKEIGGTIVQFKSNDMMRLVLKDGLTFDFCRFHGTLEEDLSKRDFTMNALAWSPEIGLVDLYDGLKDIGKKRVCSISKKNMLDDPLRMIRAYRFSAELNGTVDSQTRKTIEFYHKKIRNVSSERITLEMFYLLNTQSTSKYLKMALRDNLLNDILSLSINRLKDNLKVLDTFEREILHVIPSYIKVPLHDIFSQNLSYKGLLCLEILLQDSSGYAKFPHLKISNKIIDRVASAIEGIRGMKMVQRINHRRLFEIFMKAGQASVDSLIISNHLTMLKDFRRFQRITEKGLLGAEEVMRITGLKPGPELGSTLLTLKKSQFEGRLKSKNQAENLIKTMYSYV
jgi:tRNA nucleotidyltransferase (CCA-adding enzyme)